MIRTLLCTGGQGWEPCRGVGDTGKSSSSPAFPEFQPRVPTPASVPLISSFVQNQNSTLMHTLLQATETSRPTLRDPRSACLTQDPPLSGPRGLMGAREAEHGVGVRGTVTGPPPSDTLDQPRGFTSLSLSFPQASQGQSSWPHLPPTLQEQTRETERRHRKGRSTGRWWWKGF